MSVSGAATDGQPADDLAPSRRNITTLEGQCQCKFPATIGYLSAAATTLTECSQQALVLFVETV